MEESKPGQGSVTIEADTMYRLIWKGGSDYQIVRIACGNCRSSSVPIRIYVSELAYLKAIGCLPFEHRIQALLFYCLTPMMSFSDVASLCSACGGYVEAQVHISFTEEQIKDDKGGCQDEEGRTGRDVL